MRMLKFGEGMTEIPGGWRSKVDRQGVTVAAPPGQDVAFLWLSTLSWETPDRPGFNPAEDFLDRADAPQPARTEDRGNFIIAYFIENGPKLETHSFRVLPKRAFRTRSASAIFTLSVKSEARSLPIAQQAIQQAWEIARKVRLSDDTAGCNRGQACGEDG